jgi:hypothetical protein
MLKKTVIWFVSFVWLSETNQRNLAYARHTDSEVLLYEMVDPQPVTA